MSKPHTCPTCGGTGQRCVFYAVYVRCESCGGSGIVWEQTTPHRPITPQGATSPRLDKRA